MLSRITLSLLGAAFAASLAVPALEQAADEPLETTAAGMDYVPGEVAVKLKDGSNETCPVAADTLQEIEAEAEEVESEPSVEMAGPNYVYELEQSIDDPGQPVGVDEPDSLLDSRSSLPRDARRRPRDRFARPPRRSTARRSP